MKTQKRKAEELIIKFLPFTNWVDLHKDSQNTEWALRNAKRCALICTDEMLNNLAEILEVTGSSLVVEKIKHYKKVKTKIENYNNG